MEENLAFIFSCYNNAGSDLCFCTAPFTGKRCETNMNGMRLAPRGCHSIALLSQLLHALRIPIFAKMVERE